MQNTFSTTWAITKDAEFSVRMFPYVQLMQADSLSIYSKQNAEENQDFIYSETKSIFK